MPDFEELRHRGAGVTIDNVTFRVNGLLAARTWIVDNGGPREDDLTAEAIERDVLGGGIPGMHRVVDVSEDLRDTLREIIEGVEAHRRGSALRVEGVAVAQPMRISEPAIGVYVPPGIGKAERDFNAGVRFGGLVFRIAELPPTVWQTTEDQRLRRHGAGIEDDLTVETIRGILKAKPAGAEWQVLVSESLREQVGEVVEELIGAEPDERRPGIYVDAEDLERGFTIRNVTFRVTREMDGPVWRWSPNGMVHGESTLTRDSILQSMERHGNPAEVLAAPDLADQLLGVVREVLAEAIRRDWSISAGGSTVGEAVTFDENGHGLHGLNSRQAEVCKYVADAMGETPDAAVVIVCPEEKDRYARWVAANNEGMAAILVTPELAAALIRRDEEGRAVAAFDQASHLDRQLLASAIDEGLRSIQPEERTLRLEGTVGYDGDGDLAIGDEKIVTALMPLDGSIVGVDLSGEGIGVEGHGTIEVEKETGCPDNIEIDRLDLLPVVEDLDGRAVTLTVVEAERPDLVKPAKVETPKTAEEDVTGKTRVALAAAKLIASNREHGETPIGEPDPLGAPSRENSVVVTKLEEALMWGEADVKIKRKEE